MQSSPGFQKVEAKFKASINAAKRALSLINPQDSAKHMMQTSTRQTPTCPDSATIMADCDPILTSMASSGADLASICAFSTTCVSQLKDLYTQYKNTSGCADSYTAMQIQSTLCGLQFGCAKDGDKYCSSMGTNIDMVLFKVKYGGEGDVVADVSFRICVYQHATTVSSLPSMKKCMMPAKLNTSNLHVRKTAAGTTVWTCSRPLRAWAWQEVYYALSS